jgi:hypothetical protein
MPGAGDMSRTWFAVWLTGLMAALAAIRLTLPEWGDHGLLAGRLDTVNFAVVVAVFGLAVFIVLRVRDAGLSPLWGVAAYLWLCACEPLLRALLGDSAGLSGMPFELAALLALLVVFLALCDRPALRSRALFVAGAVALFATIARPFAIVGGIDRLFSSVLNLSGAFLTFLRRTEIIFDVAKGLGAWSSLIGNAVLIGVFLVALVAAALPEPAGPVHMRTLPPPRRRPADPDVLEPISAEAQP